MAESFATGGVGDAQLRYRDDEPCAQPAVTVEAFKGQTNATAVRLESGEDARELLPMLDRLTLVVVHFPAFTDGRGYSAARILREAGYAGELRAAGDVLASLACRGAGRSSGLGAGFELFSFSALDSSAAHPRVFALCCHVSCVTRPRDSDSRQYVM